MTLRTSPTRDTILPARRPRLRDRLHSPGRRAQAAPLPHRSAPAALFAAMAVFAAATLALVPGTPSPAGASTEPVIFSEPGLYTYTVPAGVTQLAILAAGGRGGDSLGFEGGAGGLVHAVVPVVPGDTLDVTVAGAGGFRSGGFGGGGSGLQGGGGASRVHVAWSGAPLVVAGGGGGGIGFCGGAGGGPTLPDGLDGCGDGIIGPGGGGGATTSGPGAGGSGSSLTCPSCAGEFGSGSTGGGSSLGGGGGGGYFGGGGGGESFVLDSFWFGGGGGGGSSFATPDATQVVYGVVDDHELVNYGNGFVRIAPGSSLLTPEEIVDELAQFVWQVVADAEEQALALIAQLQEQVEWLKQIALDAAEDLTQEINKVIADLQEEIDKLEQLILDLIDDTGQSHPSAECAGDVVVADGFTQGTYVRVRVDQPDPQTTWVCFRADGPSSGFGGRVEVANPDGPGAPAVVEDYVCTATPLLDGEIGDPADPATHVPYAVAVESGGGEVTVCIQVGDVQRSVTSALATGVTPEVLFDPPEPYAIAEAWPVAPSGLCVANDGEEHLNMESSGTRVRLASLQESTSRAHVCVRSDGSASVGGVLSVDTNASPGVSPVLVTGTDTDPCTLNVWTNNNPITVSVTRSPTGVPASVCVQVASTTLRVTVSTSSDGSESTVTWTPDPGSPGG